MNEAVGSGMTTERIKAEQERRRELYESLDSLDGFKGLSEVQQRLLRASVYVDQRAQREPRGPGMVREDLSQSAYALSKEHNERFFCHGAVFYLENELPLEVEPEHVDIYQHEQLYQKIERARLYDNVHEAAVKTGFPCVLRVSYSTDSEGAPRTHEALHTLIALGVNDAGEIVVWEKQGFRYPYRVATLREVQSGPYHDLSHWTVRPLMPPDKAVQAKFKSTETADAA